VSDVSRFEYVVVGLGALGSATAYQLARRGHRVIGLEQFELGHARGASHDTSRILRHSYHTPGYVALTFAAYDDWADLEADSAATLVTRVGGLDLFPPDAAIPVDDYTTSMDTCGVAYQSLDVAEVAARWPQFALPAGTVALYQDSASIVPAGRGTAVMHAEARRHGAELRDKTLATAIEPFDAGVRVRTPSATYVARRVVVCADAWTNRLLEGVGVSLPLVVTLEQVTYFRPSDPTTYQPGRMPLWIWMDDPSYYGFPCYGEDTVKAAQDCGGPAVDPHDRTSDRDAGMEAALAAHLRSTLPGTGEPLRSVRCQYTLTPDRDFVLDAVPGHPEVVVGLGAAHGFKFAPTFGRLLADLVTHGDTGTELGAFRMDRPALVDPRYARHWLV
jgi:sarcosine oxidase